MNPLKVRRRVKLKLRLHYHKKVKHPWIPAQKQGDQGPSSKIEEETAAAPPTKPSGEEKGAKKDSNKTKQKIHPFFGMILK